MKKMKTKILIALTISIVLSIGGFLTYENFFQPGRIPSISWEKVKPEPAEKLVAIFIDERTALAISEQLEQYKEDIKKDLGSEVVIFSNNFEKPDEIRNKLLELRNKGLLGAVLIGDIPNAYEKYPIGENEFVNAPMDYYYMELDENFLSLGENVFDVKKNTISSADIWVGRIKPPVSGEEGISLLKNYFKRNHAYRTGQIRPQPKMLFLDAIGRIGENIIKKLKQSGAPMLPTHESNENYLKGVERTIKGIEIYQSEQVVKVYNDDQIEVKADPYLNKLKEDFELVYFTAHGSAEVISFGESGTGGDSIYPKDIKDLKPKPYFYYMQSCGPGDFTKENYMAGWFLFAGNGLIVISPSTMIMVSIDDGVDLLYPLSLGVTFGDAHKYAPKGIFLGDPTLKIREKPKLAPKIVLEDKKIDFGEVEAKRITIPKPGEVPEPEEIPHPIEIPFRVKNAGEAILKIRFAGTDFLINGKRMSAEGTICDFIIKKEQQEPWKMELILLPGEIGVLTARFLPTLEGEYIGFTNFYTNDPDRFFISIPLMGKGM